MTRRGAYLTRAFAEIVRDQPKCKHAATTGVALCQPVGVASPTEGEATAALRVDPVRAIGAKEPRVDVG